MAPNVEFITTKQHRRFVEFAEAVRRERYIGLCYGPPGVGKTLSARRYTNWDKVEPYLDSYGLFDGKKCAEVAATRSFLYTPAVHNTPNGLDKRLNALQSRMGWAVQEAIHPDPIPAESSTAFDIRGSGFVELVIVDEADRLKTPSLEQLRDHHDRHGVGLILIGMPGIERRLARYPQLYSRIGFAHEYQPLSADELMFVLTRHWEQLSRNHHSRRLYRRRGACRRWQNHSGQFPTGPEAAGAGGPHPGDQPDNHNNQRGRRDRPGVIDHRLCIAPFIADRYRRLSVKITPRGSGSVRGNATAAEVRTALRAGHGFAGQPPTSAADGAREPAWRTTTATTAAGCPAGRESGSAGR